MVTNASEVDGRLHAKPDFTVGAKCVCTSVSRKR